MNDLVCYFDNVPVMGYALVLGQEVEQKIIESPSLAELRTSEKAIQIFAGPMQSQL
ncbi:MAG: hypothetical protein KF746_07970 [Chitinophagaceae bacterium]|nr:hypothetical protein [Chitinophagaceae bacterium]